MCRVFEEITKKQSTKSWLRPSCNPPCMFARFTTPWPLRWPLHTECTLTAHFSRQVRTILKVFRFSFPVPVVGPSKRTNAVLILGDPGAASRDYRMFDLIVNFHHEHSIVPTSSSCPYSEERGCLRNCPRMPSFLLHPSGRKTFCASFCASPAFLWEFWLRLNEIHEVRSFAPCKGSFFCFCYCCFFVTWKLL